jgi:hypothetical protein
MAYNWDSPIDFGAGFGVDSGGAFKPISNFLPQQATKQGGKGMPWSTAVSALASVGGGLLQGMGNAQAATTAFNRGEQDQYYAALARSGQQNLQFANNALTREQNRFAQFGNTVINDPAAYGLQSAAKTEDIQKFGQMMFGKQLAEDKYFKDASLRGVDKEIAERARRNEKIDLAGKYALPDIIKFGSFNLNVG